MKNDVKVQFWTTITALITAAFGMVAALAWNDAIKSLINDFFDAGTGDIVAMCIYALIVTFIAVLVTVLIARLASKAKEAYTNDEEEWESKKAKWRAEWEEEKKKEALIREWESESKS